MEFAENQIIRSEVNRSITYSITVKLMKQITVVVFFN